MAKNRSLSSLFNLESKSINVNSGHFSAKYQGYCLTVWPKIAHFHHLSLCNQNQSISSLVILSANYQGYCLTLWPRIGHFHHLSTCNQNQSMSILVICRQNTKVIALLCGKKSLILITFQSAIKNNQFQFWSFFGKKPRLLPYFLAKNRTFSSLLNLQSKLINFKYGHFSAKYQGYSLTLLKDIAHFHHFSICNQNQSMSILVIFRQNTKGIALLFGHTLLIFIAFQSAIKINQCQFWSFFGKIPRL